MDIIQVLSENIANQIAAGEVIQRPSSAVKEMLENSLDSGATNIKLVIKDAGKSLIQVIDNGCGMSHRDAKICCKRHYTSKITNLNDLFSIKTMGFRGEAMSSIGSISHLEICTKLTDQELGTKIILEGGKIKSQEESLCPDGTSIKLKNLFFNVPARRNFLKSDKIETKHIIEEFNRIAFANPDISFSLLINDKEFSKLEKSNLRQRIVNIIGNRSNESLVPIEEKTNIIKITGFITKPEFSKRTRGEQYFFVNKRFVKDYYLNHAVKKAYEDLIHETHHPSYFINLKIDPSKIDVNIHPTKTEIKLEDEKIIYSILRSSIRKSLGQYNIAPTLNFDTEPSFDIPINKKSSIIVEPKIKLSNNYNPFNINKEQTSLDNIKIEKEIQTNIDNSTFTELNLKYFQLKRNYIVTQSTEGIIIIDQQRAHERILYENLKNNNNKTEGQQLIFPKKMILSKRHINDIIEMKKDLECIGFKFNVSKETLKITAIPSSCLDKDLECLFEEILKDNEIIKTNLKEKLHSRISKSLSKSLSIKSGTKLNTDEMKMIVSKLMKCEIPSVSPFGLTTYFNITNNEIIKKFN